MADVGVTIHRRRRFEDVCDCRHDKHNMLRRHHDHGVRSLAWSARMKPPDRLEYAVRPVANPMRGKVMKTKWHREESGPQIDDYGDLDQWRNR